MYTIIMYKFSPLTQQLFYFISLHQALQVKVKVTLRLTVSQSVSLGVESHLGLMTRYVLLFDSYGLIFLRRPL
jgi:hypothetical protein